MWGTCLTLSLSQVFMQRKGDDLEDDFIPDSGCLILSEDDEAHYISGEREPVGSIPPVNSLIPSENLSRKRKRREKEKAKKDKVRHLNEISCAMLTNGNFRKRNSRFCRGTPPMIYQALAMYRLRKFLCSFPSTKKSHTPSYLH
jgi:hypothetical protein